MEKENEMNELNNCSSPEELPVEPQDASTTQQIEEELFPKPKKQKTIEIFTKSSVFSYFLNAMIIFGVCFICCWFVFYVLFTQVEVVGLSMLPTINNSAYNEKDEDHIDIVYIMKSNNYNYKDIVVIKEGKTTSNSRLIKRIVGMPGQTITFRKTGESPSNNRVFYEIYIDNQKLIEDYVKEDNFVFYTSIDSMNFYTYYKQLISELTTTGSFSDTLENNEYFVMGDNRNNSTDSRFFGPVTKNEIVGKSVLQVKYGDTLFKAIWTSLFNANLCY